MKKFILRFASDESGATVVEYALLLSLLALLIIAGVTATGQNIGKSFNSIAANMK